jgi:thioredoxin-related protein
MVIMAHLGCPAAMLLFKDLETLKTDQLQILIILEDSRQQVLDFNSTDKNLWSDVRNYFKLNPVEQVIIAECEASKIKHSGNDIRIETQCRKLAKKIKTKDSPTLVKVNEKGEITTIIKGYFGDQEQSERLRKFMEIK